MDVVWPVSLGPRKNYVGVCRQGLGQFFSEFYMNGGDSEGVSTEIAVSIVVVVLTNITLSTGCMIMIYMQIWVCPSRVLKNQGFF